MIVLLNWLIRLQCSPDDLITSRKTFVWRTIEIPKRTKFLGLLSHEIDTFGRTMHSSREHLRSIWCSSMRKPSIECNEKGKIATSAFQMNPQRIQRLFDWMRFGIWFRGIWQLFCDLADKALPPTRSEETSSAQPQMFHFNCSANRRRRKILSRRWLTVQRETQVTNPTVTSFFLPSSGFQILVKRLKICFFSTASFLGL